MKKFILAASCLVGLLFMMGEAKAFVLVNPHITVAPNVVTATVVNPYPRAIICSGYAFGRSAYSGQVFNSWMNGIVIYSYYAYFYLFLM